MKLGSINRWLRRIGLVLVLEIGDADEPLRPAAFRLDRASRHPIVRDRC